MSIFNRENFNFGWTSYYKRIPKGEDIPISIGDGIQIETIYSGNEPVEVRLNVPEPKYVEKSEGYFYRNPYGYETPVELEGVEIERNITQDSILVKGSIEPTYLHGKPIEDFTQSELHTHLKGLLEVLQ